MRRIPWVDCKDGWASIEVKNLHKLLAVARKAEEVVTDHTLKCILDIDGLALTVDALNAKPKVKK